MLCRVLSQITPEDIRNSSDEEEPSVTYWKKKLGCTVDKLLETRCVNTVNFCENFFKVKQSYKITIDDIITSQYNYFDICLMGIDMSDELSHCFVIIRDSNNEYLLVDSYACQRSVTITKFTKETLQNYIHNLKQFLKTPSAELWYKLTLQNESKFTYGYMAIVMGSYVNTNVDYKERIKEMY